MLNANLAKSTLSRRRFLAGATAAGISAILAACDDSVAPAESPETTPGKAPATPIKLVCVIRKRSDLTAEQFYDYWLNSHGPLATEQILKLGGYRYVQSHTRDTNLNTLIRTSRGQVDTPFEGITEVWFRSEEELVAASSTPAGVEANTRLALDETNFIDLAQSSYFFTTEHVLLEG